MIKMGQWEQSETDYAALRKERLQTKTTINVIFYFYLFYGIELVKIVHCIPLIIINCIMASNKEQRKYMYCIAS